MADDPKYDSLRFRPWFTRLQKRKKIIPALEQAYLLVQQGQPQWSAAAEFQVDERELRDYSALKTGESSPRAPVYQRVIDDAYTFYCHSKLTHSFSFCMEKAASEYGLNPRACRELWETDPGYYPTVYQKEK